MMTPSEILIAGRQYLDPLLQASGYTLVLEDSDRGSGGPFVQAAYVRAARRLEFSVRHTLGLVQYVDAGLRLDHEDLVRAASVGGQRGEYPGYNTDPAMDFSDLANDLSRFGASFLDSGPEPFAKVCIWVANHPRPKGMQAI